MKKIAVLAILLFLPRAFAFADVTLNEIMYDLKSGSDSSREWIEVYNNTSAPVDFSTYRLFEGGVNHKLKLISGSGTILPKGYAVVASDAVKFKVDYPNFSGSLFDSAFSLSNTGETLAIKNNDIVLDQYSYSSSQGGAGDGNSLQKINGSWLGATPTPGMVNVENKVVPVLVTPPQDSQVKPATTKASATSTKFPEIISGNSPRPIPGKIPTASTTSTPEGSSGSNSYLFEVFLVIFLGICAFGVFFIRKSGKKPSDGDDFDILE